MKNLRKYGNQPHKIAVIHGGPGASGEMRSVAEYLSSKKGILEPLQTSHTIKGEINQLKTMLLASNKSPFILIGFSWGAWLSLLTAANYPTLVEKVIIIGCGPLEQKYVEQINKTRLSRLDPTEKAEFTSLLNDLKKRTKKDTNTLIKNLKNLTNKTDQYRPIDNFKEKINFDRNIFQNIWNEAMRLRKSGELLERIDKIDCPVIAIHGTYDPHPIEGVGEPLSRILTDFRLIKLARCGHKPWNEQEARERFYNILIEELQ
mgnify:CR=1 FL=1